MLIPIVLLIRRLITDPVWFRRTIRRADRPVTSQTHERLIPQKAKLKAICKTVLARFYLDHCMVGFNVESAEESKMLYRNHLIVAYILVIFSLTACGGGGGSNVIADDDGGGDGGGTLFVTNSNWAQFPVVATNGQGKAVVVWQQVEGMSEVIAANRFLDGWTGIEPAYGGGWGMMANVNMSKNGHIAVSWLAVDSSGNRRVWVRRYVADSGWQTSEPMMDQSTSAYADKQKAFVVELPRFSGRFNIWGLSPALVPGMLSLEVDR